MVSRKAGAAGRSRCSSFPGRGPLSTAGAEHCQPRDGLMKANLSCLPSLCVHLFLGLLFCSVAEVSSVDLSELQSPLFLFMDSRVIVALRSGGAEPGVSYAAILVTSF